MVEPEAEVWMVIADDHEALKLIATWPNAYREGEEIEDCYERWSGLSGVDDVRINYLKDRLFGNGILKPDGTVAERILGLMRMQVAQQVQKGGAPRRAT